MSVESKSSSPRRRTSSCSATEKGGSGKSTIAMHVAVALLNCGQRVATIDLDCASTRALTHYIEHRRAWAGRAGLG